jgi:histidine triad (HIT) family protein
VPEYLFCALAAETVPATRVAVAEGVSDAGYRVVFNTSPRAGQAVPHVHAHVLGGRSLT